ncbi:hypothetical protein DFJ58DRAFT_782102 [Suillus subalutaceus]|uniref:uncharacterized protein n=1 Tax=Suillus subalutaceus TaxID=48586 RepID=UPI001B885DC8|nr:uncharacterized protein DFJ58DRAFT_782102 [Suillus subalutaceus]KAG1858410.1 hypothetical protein DFJ58DRAFT_782102 [Suillus subalutaceus]
MQLPMSGLPPKPEVSRTANSWPEPTDDRRYVGRPVPMAAPDHYRPRRDDRDRDRERERDRDRDRSYHPPRSPAPRSPRGRDTYTSPSRNDTHREYYHRDERPRERGWEPDRRVSERRDDRAWTRDEHSGRGRGRGRGHSNERRREHYSPTKSSRRSYSPRRYSRPPSDGSAHRYSSRSPVKHESGHSPHPPSGPRSHYSDHRGDRRRGSRTPSPRPSRRSLSRDVKPAHEETRLPASPAHSQRSLRAPDEKPATKSASPYTYRLKAESVIEDAHTGRSPAINAVKTPPTPGSPALSFKHLEEPPGEMPKLPTAPFLPPFTRRETLKERLGQKYKDELTQIEAIEASRSRAASEQVQISKAVRRAMHELEITSIDLRAAQIRREHAENHRRKAASANGFFDFEAEFSGSTG